MREVIAKKMVLSPDPSALPEYLCQEGHDKIFTTLDELEFHIEMSHSSERLSEVYDHPNDILSLDGGIWDIHFCEYGCEKWVKVSTRALTASYMINDHRKECGPYQDWYSSKNGGKKWVSAK